MIAVLDTNIVLRLLGGRLVDPLPPGAYAVSVITEMELLSYPEITPREENGIREFLTNLTLVDLTPGVRNTAVRLRRDSRLKLPDAIVAATAVEMGVELFTNDQRLARTPGVRCRPLAVK